VYHSIVDVQTSLILDSIQLEIGPQDALRVCQSVSTRYRNRLPRQIGYSQELLTSLYQWSLSKASSLVLACGSQRASLQGFAVDIINHIQTTESPIIWGFCAEEIDQPISPLASLFKSLVFQVVRLRLDNVANPSTTMDVTPFRLAETTKQWTNVLISCLEGIPLLFLVITAEVLDQVNATDLSKELSNVIEKVPMTCLKILLTGRDSTNFFNRAGSAMQNSFIVVRLGSRMPLTPRERGGTNLPSRSQRGRRGQDPRMLSNRLKFAFAKAE